MPAQTVNGWQDIFNTLAEEHGLPVRDRGLSDGRVSHVRRQLADGYPVVVHGSFNSGHLIVLLGFDGDYYYVHDPAGDWLMGHPSGRHSRYDREPVDRAIASDGWVRYHALYPVDAPALALEPALPDSVVAGQRVRLATSLRLSDSGNAEPLVADLSALGGPASAPLLPEAGGTLRLEASFTAAGQGLAEMAIRAPGGDAALYTRSLAVLAPRDVTVFDDQTATGWSASSADGEVAVSADRAVVGQQSLAVSGQGIGLLLRPDQPLSMHGFSHLPLAFHPGEAAVGGDSLLAVYLNGDIRGHALLHGYGAEPRVEPERRAWQTVEIPMAELAFVEQPLESLHILGHLAGTVYIDDVQLIAARPCPVGIAWQVQPPDSLRLGEPADLALRIQVTSQAEGEAPPVLVADLSALGGSAETPLVPLGGGRFELLGSVCPQGPNGLRQTSVRISQTAAGRAHTAELTHTVVLVPENDCAIYAAGELSWPVAFADKCEVTPSTGAPDLEGSGSDRGEVLAVDASYFTIDLETPAPVEPVGYRALHLAFCAGDVTAPSRPTFSLIVNGDVRTAVRLMGGDDPALSLTPDSDGWQVVTVPLDAFGELEEPIETIRLLGNLRGRFYLDDIRLVADQVSPPVPTAVAETAALPGTASLEPAYPNPFNSATTLVFHLADTGPAEMTIRNCLGQVVWRRASARLEAGTHRVTWDGRQSDGQAAATGVYYAQLATRARTWSRPLLLLR